jgi:hypothetical protein
MLGSDGKLELLDFKASELSTDPLLLATHEDQLCTYAHILERRHAAPDGCCLPDCRGEQGGCVMEMPYTPDKVDGVVSVRRRLPRFAGIWVSRVPERKVCKEDLRLHAMRKDDQGGEPVMVSDYASIRVENERRYGTDIGRWPDVVGRPIRRSTHLYELLQNAEDALARRGG